MNIGFVATRLAGVDGVSLESAKLAQVFNEMGHETFFCAGALDEKFQPGKVVPTMHFNHPDVTELHDMVFLNGVGSPDIYQRIYAAADALRAEIEAFIKEYRIRLLVPQNINCIPMNIALGVASADVLRRNRIHGLAHHHDFYWERERFILNDIQDILDSAFPPKLDNVQHMCISTVMQQRLRAWRGIESYYLPNVFDFENPPPPPDDYANTFRAELGLSDDDLIVLQPTRIVRRKAIEKAIELVRKLDDDRLVLLITGYEGDEAGAYGDWLREEAEASGIRYDFIGDYVGESRGMRDGHRVYALWDIYPHAHFVTYPSTYEGFGNALIETLYFRKPLVVHTYPQYAGCIAPAGVFAIEFHHDITDDVIDNTRAMIDDEALRERMVEHNYRVGLEAFSYRVLRGVLGQALANIEH